MEPAEHLAAIERETDAFAEAAAAGLDRPCETCPDWSVAQLTVHLGVVHRWAAETVRSRSPERIARSGQGWEIEPGDPRIVEWYRESAAELLDALRATDPSEPLWTFGPDKTAAFWLRRQAHETAVHRFDAASATGGDVAMDGRLASDGVDEALTVTVTAMGRARSTEMGTGQRVHLHCTDVDGEWLVTFEDQGMTVVREHAKGDAAIRGAAADLLLFLWGRVGLDRLEVLGDASLASRWFELAPSF